MSAVLRFDLLKVDLGVMTCADQQELYLRSLLTSAEGFILRRGVPLNDDSDEDDMLVASVAAWMYRARGTVDRAQLPRNLDIQLKDRLCAAKMMEGNGDDL